TSSWLRFWLEQIPKCLYGGVITRHAVYAPARRSRGGANINSFCGSPIRRKPQRRTINQLCEVDDATVDIAPYVVCVVRLHRYGILCVRRQDRIAKTRREARYLGRDRLRHVYVRTMGHVAIRPPGVLARGRARAVDDALLGKQNKRPFRNLAAPRLPLASGDFFKRSASVRGACWPGVLRGERSARAQ